VKSGHIARTIRTTAGLAGFLAFTVPLPGAELKPPLQALRHPNYTLIVAQRLDRPVTEARMPVRVIERLRGDSDVPDEIELLVQAGDEESVEAGKAYLLFYSDVERVNFKPRKEIRRPDRRKLLHIDGAGPAVFEDTPRIRALLDPAHSAIEQGPQYRAIVLEGLASDDPVMVDLWSAEWTLRPATFAEVKSEEICLLRGIVEDPAQRPAARTRILVAGARRTSPAAGRWYAASAHAILDQTLPAQLDDSTGLSQLVYASLRIAQGYPDAATAPQLRKWLKAKPPLAENAALALRAIEPELERQAVRSAIADEATPDETQLFLADHLRRLERVNSKTQ